MLIILGYTYPTALSQSTLNGVMYDAVDVELLQNGIFFREFCNPGANVIADTIAPNNSIIAYINLVDVEFLHDGHAEQHNEHAVPVQQQAS